ncbi:MAG: curli production assembly/transport protein CsgG, partial [Polaromonas sp.]|nr:curli production assembly/transport protein CsgG [Polaromonas sp.]
MLINNRKVCLLLSVAMLSACSQMPISAPSTVKPANAREDAVLTPGTRISRELQQLPAPEYRLPVGVYAFRDQTGQFKPQPESNLSSAVTQGAASILVKTLLESGWFIPVEREGLQNLLTERRVARAIELPGDRGRPGSSYPQLLAASYLIEGGIVGYEQNVRTGGEGANYLGIGADVKYMVDQVTINLRTVDVRTSQVLASVSVTKTIYSHSFSGSINTYVAWKKLLQTEGGFTSNEPGQLAIKQAIESGVVHLILQGLRYGAWNLQNQQDWFNPVLQAYAREAEALQTG